MNGPIAKSSDGSECDCGVAYRAAGAIEFRICQAGIFVGAPAATEEVCFRGVMITGQASDPVLDFHYFSEIDDSNSRKKMEYT